MAFSKARRLSDLVSSTGEISSFVDGSITHADLHTNMDLTGKTVLVTTQSASDNDTSAASTAYVTTAISNLIDSAPGTMNTLNEIAAALNDDANFNTTVTNAIAGKLPLAGGTMTGHLNFGDNVQVRLGTGGDFLVYHDGINSRLASAAHPIMTSSNIVQFLSADTTETMLKATQNSSVELYHDNSVKLATTAGGIAVTGQGDFSTQVLVGNNNSHFSENNLRFYSPGDAYIDHATTSTAFQFRGSESSALDSNILHLGHSLITAQQEVKVNAQSGNYNFRAYAQDGDSWFGVYDDANNSANIIVTRSDSAVSFRHLGHAGQTDILGQLTIARHGNTTETANNAILKINGNTSNAFNHGIEYFNNALTAGEAALIVVGSAGSTKNSGYIGYRYNSAGSDGNMVTFGHWGADNLLTIDGIGRVGIGTTTSGSDSRLHIKDANTDYRGEFKFETGTGGVTGKIILRTTDNSDESAFIRKRAYYLEFNAHDNEGIIMGTNSTELLRLCGPNNATTAYRNAAVVYGSGGCVPSADNQKDLGSTTLRWRNVYTTDLQLSNENTGGNDVDGTEGNWTLQEGETNLYIINNKSGKKYKFALEEIE